MLEVLRKLLNMWNSYPVGSAATVIIKGDYCDYFFPSFYFKCYFEYFKDLYRPSRIAMGANVYYYHQFMVILVFSIVFFIFSSNS